MFLRHPQNGLVSSLTAIENSPDTKWNAFAVKKNSIDAPQAWSLEAASASPRYANARKSSSSTFSAANAAPKPYDFAAKCRPTWEYISDRKIQNCTESLAFSSVKEKIRALCNSSIASNVLPAS